MNQNLNDEVSAELSDEYSDDDSEMVEFEPVAGNEIWLPDDAPSWEDLGANGQTRFMRKNGIPLDNLDGLGVARIRTLYEQARPESMDDIINPEDEEDWPTDWGNQEGEDEEEPADIVIAGGGSSSNGMGAGSGSGAGRGSRRRGAGRNGKGYRAVELPIELIQIILDLAADDLLGAIANEVQMIRVFPDNRTGPNDYPLRWLVAALRTIQPVLKWREVCPAWNQAVEKILHWDTIASWLALGYRGRSGEIRRSSKFRDVVAILRLRCWICMLHSSVSTADRVSTTFFGSIPVCEAHEEDFCGRCLNVDEPSAYELNLAECSGDSRFFGKTSSSCSPCREDVITCLLRDAGHRSVKDANDPGWEPFFDAVTLAERSATSAVFDIIERRWLDKNTPYTSFADQIRQAEYLASRQARRLERQIAMATEEDEFESEEEGDDESLEYLSPGAHRQVLDMSLRLWMQSRLLAGLWISPTEAAAHQSRPPNFQHQQTLDPIFPVQRPLPPFTISTSDHEPHRIPDQILSRSYPPYGRSSELVTLVPSIYAEELRALILPAMTQIVRYASLCRDPIAVASSLDASAILDFLRYPGAWVPRGLDYLVSPPQPLPQPTTSDQSVEERGPPPNQSGAAAASGTSLTSSSPSTNSPPTSKSPSTPPTSTSPPSSVQPTLPPSPSKDAALLLNLSNDARPMSGPLAPPAVPSRSSAKPTPVPPPARPVEEEISQAPLHRIPCIPLSGYPIGPTTSAIISCAWVEAWAPLKVCRCRICMRGLGLGTAPTEINSNGKRRESDATTFDEGKADELAGLVERQVVAEVGPRDSPSKRAKLETTT